MQGLVVSRKRRSWGGLLTLVGIGFCCCSSQDIQPGAVALPNGPSIGKVNVINGSYGPGCIDRLGDWSLATDDACALPNPSLSVTPGNQNCVLTITSVLVDCVTYNTHGIVLNGAYQPFGYSFVKDGECTTSFYANATISDPSFFSNFLMKFIFSPNLSDTSADAIAHFDKISAFVIDVKVLAPDYLADLSGLQVGVDNTAKVTFVGGAIHLQPGLHLGETYVVIPTPLAPGQKNYHDINTFFQTSTQQPISVPISASALGLLNQTLTTIPAVQRNIIIAHTENLVPSYELITITFTPP